MKRIAVLAILCLATLTAFAQAPGVTFHLKPERTSIPRQFRKPIPNPPIVKPQPMLQRSQGYIGEFEKQFLKEKNER